jgi:Holliday junction resolvase RusA-like endonuclease
MKNSQEPHQPKSEALKDEPSPIFSGPISVDVTFYFPHTIHKKNKLKRWHIIRPDLDNCVKFILDVATGITYNDDCIVSDIHARKMYSDSPRTEFTISELKEN